MSTRSTLFRWWRLHCYREIDGRVWVDIGPHVLVFPLVPYRWIE